MQIIMSTCTNKKSVECTWDSIHIQKTMNLQLIPSEKSENYTSALK